MLVAFSATVNSSPLSATAGDTSSRPQRIALFYYLKNLGTIFFLDRAGGAGTMDLPMGLGELEANGKRVRRSRNFDAFLWLWATTLLVFFSALPHQEPRYIMPVAPPLFLLAGIGLGVDYSRSTPKRGANGRNRLPRPRAGLYISAPAPALCRGLSR